MKKKNAEALTLGLYHVKIGSHHYYVEAFQQAQALGLVTDKLVEHTAQHRAYGWTDPEVTIQHIGAVDERAVSPEETARREVEELLR